MALVGTKRGAAQTNGVCELLETPTSYSHTSFLTRSERDFNMKLKILMALYVGIVLTASATHLRGGEITARRVSETSLTYEFTINLFCDSRNGAPACAAANEILYFCLGDGTVVKAPRVSNRDIGNNTSHSIYRYTYTFPAPGIYRISAMQENRNDNVRNMNNSVNTNFYIATTLVINSAVGQNTTPILLNPPVDFTAVVGQKWTHNPAAFDAEGDSLSYRMVVPQQGTGASFCGGIAVNNYRDPDKIGSCGASFGINALTGDLTWESPCEAGQYNVAFVIEEWRKGPDGTYVKIGEVIRDMQIVVEDADNARPELEVPPALCIEAGKRVEFVVRATDKASRTGRVDRVLFSAFGGVFNQSPNPNLIVAAFAGFAPTTSQASPASGTFSWQTNCSHIRQQPYDVLFKVEDVPPPGLNKLIDSKTVKITVVAPRPTGLTTTVQGAKSIRLNWNAYACVPQGSTPEMIIYRKEGCSNNTIDICKPTIPAGYIEIARVPIVQTSYIDDNRGVGLKRNTDYSYRIAVSFGTGLGISAASDESCRQVSSTMPVLTNVTVDKTDATTGEITVKWTRPIGAFDTRIFTGPYQYRLFRTTGLSGTSYAQITSINTALGTQNDTTFVDKTLNTRDNAYRYRLNFYYTQNGVFTLVDSTDAASSVRLTAATAVRSVDLSWQANTPWNNQNQRHRVYRKVSPTQYNLIAEVPVTSAATFRYNDNGTDTFAADGTFSIRMQADSQYCYRVETVGTYADPKIKPDLLYNFSQEACATPRDTTRPCPPILKIDDLTCDVFNTQTPCTQTVFKNTLTWTNPDKNARGEDCSRDLIRYNVYYSPREKEVFMKIGEVSGTKPLAQTYLHQNLTSLAGCYYVTAVSSKGLESDRSNVVCKDNCVTYKLPNVITPNGDGKNDTFTPLDCPRFVAATLFVVYNRQGTKVYEGANDPAINWKGTDTNGNPLAFGTYYYEAQVRTIRLNADNEVFTVKGWVEVLR